MNIYLLTLMQINTNHIRNQTLKNWMLMIASKIVEGSFV